MQGVDPGNAVESEGRRALRSVFEIRMHCPAGCDTGVALFVLAPSGLSKNKNSFDDPGNLMHNRRLRLKKNEVSA